MGYIDKAYKITYRYINMPNIDMVTTFHEPELRFALEVFAEDRILVNYEIRSILEMVSDPDNRSCYTICREVPKEEIDKCLSKIQWRKRK